MKLLGEERTGGLARWPARTGTRCARRMALSGSFRRGSTLTCRPGCTSSRMRPNKRPGRSTRVLRWRKQSTRPRVLVSRGGALRTGVPSRVIGVAVEPRASPGGRHPRDEHHEAAAGGDPPARRCTKRRALDRLRRHAVLVPDPSVAPTDESGPRYTEAASRQAAFVLNASEASRIGGYQSGTNFSASPLSADLKLPATCVRRPPRLQDDRDLRRLCARPDAGCRLGRASVRLRRGLRDGPRRVRPAVLMRARDAKSHRTDRCRG